jgi:hypothetical protein
MKKSIGFAGFSLFVVALVLAAPAVAQQSTYIIQVPFSFHVNAQVFPAGEYRVGVLSQNPATMQIRGIDHAADGMFVAPRHSRQARGPRDAELVFHRYGRQYFLSQVWFAGRDDGYQFFVSQEERENAKRSSSSPESVLLAAK